MRAPSPPRRSSTSAAISGSPWSQPGASATPRATFDCSTSATGPSRWGPASSRPKSARSTPTTGRPSSTRARRTSSSPSASQASPSPSSTRPSYSGSAPRPAPSPGGCSRGAGRSTGCAPSTRCAPSASSSRRSRRASPTRTSGRQVRAPAPSTRCSPPPRWSAPSQTPGPRLVRGQKERPPLGESDGRVRVRAPGARPGASDQRNEIVRPLVKFDVTLPPTASRCQAWKFQDSPG